MPSLRKHATIALLFGALLSGCGLNGAIDPIIQPSIKVSQPELMDKVNQALAQAPAESKDHRRYQAEGLIALNEGRLDDAHHLFNLALDRDAKNADLHFLNSYTYELLAKTQGKEYLEMASVGYQTALKFNPAHWLASFRLGHWHLINKEYDKARSLLANALLLEPEHPGILYDLAVASYYLHDPQAARAMLETIPRGFSDTALVHQAKALTYAALGEQKKALAEVKRFGALSSSISREIIEKRVEQWRQFHARLDGGELFLKKVGFFGDDGGESAGGLGKLGSGGGAPVAANEEGPALPDMIVVDVVVIRESESASDSHGINVLSSLYLTATSTIKDSLTTVVGTTLKLATTSGGTSMNYALNLANVADSTSKIMARPSLSVLDGETASFFLGSELTYMGTGEAARSYDKEVGLTMQVTPETQADGRVRITANVEFDQFVESFTATAEYAQKMETLKNKVDSTALLLPGETLVLGGGTTSNQSDSESAVPFLGKVPGLQYLFNSQSTTTTETSLIILITPRKASSVDDQKTIEEALEGEDKTSGKIDASSMALLKKRFKYWFKPTNNLTKTMLGLSKTDLYREFRQGDLELIDLDKDGDMDYVDNAHKHRTIIDEIIGMIYF
ncbi:tetratricopeptide repeat protein [Magnetococcus sp. PR-3]|uniref:tetratricopeptide repeat protein n=1 Tax=Magnetococcus sp. PR-3 TaxID=3120355 RepID=UPI002FCDF6E0